MTSTAPETARRGIPARLGAIESDLTALLRAGAAVLLVVAALGCRTVPIPAFEPIAIPRGLSSQQIELAILSGILNKPPPLALDPTHPMPAADFDRLIWQSYMYNARSRSWFPESRKPGEIIAAVDTRGHYLQVSLRYDQGQITTEILQSRNLLQEGGEIHKKAVAWIANLHEHIRRELGRMAFATRAPS